MQKLTLIAKIFIFLISLLFAAVYLVERPSKTQSALFVSSAPLTGPAKHLGIQYTNGINAYFKYSGDKKMLGDCKIVFEIYDDHYEPFLTSKNISTALSRNKKAFGILGVVGTPTSEEAVKIAAKKDAPFLAPFSGANFLYETHLAQNFMLRPSYQLEADNMVEFFVKQGIEKIAVFYQNDGYGLSALKSIKNAAQKTNLEVVSEGVYNRNTLSVKYAFNEIKKSNPQVVVIAGTYKPAIEFVEKAQNSGLEWLFFNFSFTGFEPLLEEAQKKIKDPNRIFITQVTPPLFINEESTEEFKKIYAEYYPHEKPNSVAFEGFLAAKVVVAALKNGGCDSKDSFISNLTKLQIKLTEDATLNYTKTDHTGIKKVYLLRFNKEGAQLVK